MLPGVLERLGASGGRPGGVLERLGSVLGRLGAVLVAFKVVLDVKMSSQSVEDRKLKKDIYICPDRGGDVGMRWGAFGTARPV